MVTSERLHFTLSIAAPAGADAAGAAGQRRVVRHTVQTMQALLDHLPPPDVERVCSQIEALLQPGGAQTQDGVVDQMIAGRTYDVPERVALELGNLARDFRWRRDLLAGSLSAPEVARLLGTSRQTPHDRVAAGTLLAVRDQGALRFPAWQFDPQGPHGVVGGLADVLRALRVPSLSQASWLTRPNSHLGGSTPLAALRRGQVAEVTRLAQSVGAT